MRPLRRVAAVTAALLLAAAATPRASAGADVDVAALLARIVDARTPDARRTAAESAARTPGLTLDAALEAARAFGVFEPQQAGTLRIDVPGGGAVQVFVPGGYDPARPTPLILALHGTGGDGEQALSLWQGFAERNGFLVAAPETSGANAGYTFGEAERDEGWAALRAVRRRLNVDENRIHATGVSRGGHMTWDLALRRPDVFASLAPMIGGPRLDFSRGSNNTRFVENVAHLPIRDLQGEQDDPRLLANLRMVFARLEALHAPDARLVTFAELGHSFDPSAVDWDAFLGGARREPWPERVVVRGAAPGVRSHFAEIAGVERDVVVDFRPRVDAKTWPSLGEDAQRRVVAEQIEAATARLEVRRTARGRYEATSDGVTGFRLLLPAEGVGEDGRVVVRWKGRDLALRAEPSLAVLLRDFAERFDRTSLVVCEVRVGR